MKKAMKKTMNRMLVLLLAVSIFAGTLDLNAFAVEPKVVTGGAGWDGVTTQNVCETENLRITYTLSSYWSTGYNADIKLENISSSTIQNWYLGFSCDDEITNIWNAQISSHVGNQYVIKNAGWNQDIAVGGSVEFGISGSTEFGGFPQGYALVGSKASVADTDYSIEYQVYSDWGSGVSAAITVTNNTDSVLEEWALEFDYDREIESLWNGSIESQAGNHYIITNAGYNGNIYAGQAITIGFNAGEGTGSEEPRNCKLYSYCANTTGNGTVEVDKNQDTDGDGVADYLEEHFGTDINKLDTDGDGLSDYIELSGFVFSPLLMDTDGNGINDGDEDTDADGLSNIRETELGTSVIKADTDNDGLSDNDEVSVYATSPLQRDTDSDYVSDAKEIELGTNPLVYDETFDIILYADEEDTIKASVHAILKGRQVESLSVEKFNNDFFFPTTMPGYLGGAYDFQVTEGFGSDTIQFEFNTGLLADASFDPIIYYFNEELQQLEALETSVTGNVASVQISRCGKYILLNKTAYEAAFEWEEVESYNADSGIAVMSLIDELDDSATGAGQNSEQDSDGDGIADCYEAGLYFFNGVKFSLDPNNPDTDGDGLYDGEEVTGFSFQYNSDKTKKIAIGFFGANPLEGDSDGDRLTDEEEGYVGTSALLKDTDADGLADGIEVDNWYDPLEPDADGDGRLDLQEYKEGTNPFSYDKDWYEHLWDFVCGFVAGDFIHDTDSIATTLGQIASSFIPLVDIRDVIGNLVHGDFLFAGLSATGLIPVGGDLAKTAGKVGKFVLKNIDDIAKVSDILEFLVKNLPDALPYLAGSDEFADAMKQLSKVDTSKLTKKDADVINEALEKAGMSEYIIKRGSIFDSISKLPANQGFETFADLKKAIGPAGEGKHWHHIVEQSQIVKSGFSAQQVHNTSNIIAVDATTHAKITGYYNTKTFDFTGGLSVREWLVGQSYEYQYEFGLDVLRKYGVIE